MTNNQGNSKAHSKNHNRIAQAVFAEAELRGITDRKLLEESTNKVIQVMFSKEIDSKEVMRKLLL